MFLGPLSIVITEGNPKEQRPQRIGARESAGEGSQAEKLFPVAVEPNRLYRNTLFRIDHNPNLVKV